MIHRCHKGNCLQPGYESSLPDTKCMCSLVVYIKHNIQEWGLQNLNDLIFLSIAPHPLSIFSPRGKKFLHTEKTQSYNL